MAIREPAAHVAVPIRREAAKGYVRFSINWGESEGAAPNRVLGHVCRRGEIRGSQVGAIEIGADRSGFDIDASVAARFENLVRRPDRRDPHLRGCIEEYVGVRFAARGLVGAIEAVLEVR